MRRRAPVVVKFGGESLSEPELVVRRVRELRRGGTPVVVVVSARAGVTDLLKRVFDPSAPRRDAEELVAEIRRIHPELPRSADRVLADTGRLVRRRRRAGTASLRTQDELLSQGERLAAHWFATVLERAGIPATPIEADAMGLTTDTAHGAARILLDVSEARVRSRLLGILARGRVPVVTGFFGVSQRGHVATLGRGGSDYSASAIGAILGAARVELVKRNVAISTADPKLVPGALPVAHLSYEEAEEIAQFGARVLHPVTIEPAQSRRVPIYVRSLNHHPLLTIIGPAGPRARSRAVTLLAPLRLVSLRVAGGRQRPGLLAEITRRLVAAHVNLAAVVTTEAVLGLLVDPVDARRTRSVLQRLAKSKGAVVGQPISVALVSAVGEGILGEIHRLPRRYLPRAEGLLATARSISFLIREESAVPALRDLHAVFVERRSSAPRS